MQTDGQSGRRLRFDLVMDDGESIPGAIARGVRDHVLVRTRPVLDAAGVDLRHVGYSQLAKPRELERLAYVIRCAPERLSANAGVGLSAGTGTKVVDVRFGAHVMPRSHLELDRRRVSPMSLDARQIHRLSWMNLLLPYCPESLERLVSVCADCGSTLGWHFSWGIGTCEHCGEKVKPSGEPSLPTALANDYRLFARLSSPGAAQVAQAIATMPEALHKTPSATLVRLTLLLGGLVQQEPVATTSRLAVLELPKPLLASIITAGVALLRSWPTGIQSWVAGRAEEVCDDPAGLRALRTRLQRLTSRGQETDDLVELVAAAFPDLRLHAAHGFTGGCRRYVYKQVQKLLGLDGPQMDALRRRDDLGYRRQTTATHEKGQFDAERIDRLVPAFRQSVQLNACTGELRLPLYAIELCCRPDLLVWEDEPAFLEVKSRTAVRLGSLQGLRMRLIAGKSQEPQPSGLISLSAASKRIGGRLKPWSSIVRALLEGDLPYWLSGALPTTASIRVQAAALAAFDQAVDGPLPAGMEPGRVVSQADAAEILNLKSEQVAAWSETLGIPFAPSGRALVAPLAKVIDVARGIAWTAEISLHVGIHPVKVQAGLTERGIRRVSTGWCRQHLMDKTILPLFPEKKLPI